MPTVRRVDFVHASQSRPARYIPDGLEDRVQPVTRGAQEVVRTHDAWLKEHLDDKWTAFYRVVPQNGQPVIAEVRVIPRESFVAEAAEWSAYWLGVKATVPPGGITARHLRSLRTSETVAESLPAWKRFLELALGAKRVYRQWGFRRLRAPRAGSRRGWSDEDLLRAAVDYVEIGGRRRVIELAKRWGIERTQARDLLNACTQKGYLTRGRPGVASRGLTDHALQILAERSKK